MFSDLSDKNRAFMEWKKKENHDNLMLKKLAEKNGKSSPKTTKIKKPLNPPYYKLMGPTKHSITINNKNTSTISKKESSILTKTREIINVERLYKIKNYLIESGLKL